MWSNFGSIFGKMHSLQQDNGLSKFLIFGDWIRKRVDCSMVNEQYKKFTDKALESIKALQVKSVNDSEFKYTEWSSVVDVNIIPKCDYFSFYVKNDENVQKYVNFYKKYKPVICNDTVNNNFVELSKLMLSGKIKLPTFQSIIVVKNICKVAQENWCKLSHSLKVACWSLVIGYIDNVKYLSKSIVKNTSCKSFVSDEVSKGRLIEVKCVPFSKYICPRYFELPEEKVDTTTGIKYTKIRRVCDCTISNTSLLPPAKNLSYAFNMAESLFKNIHYFRLLMKSKLATVTDKSDYYRDLPKMIDSTSFVKCDNKMYADINIKMGSTFSSAFSQLTANLLDFTFNHTYKGCTSISLQDDSLFLQGQHLEFDKIKRLNENFGFTLNSRKSQCNKQHVKWSGYLFNLHDKIAKLPVEKTEKIVDLKNVVIEGNCSRRLISKLLGKVYSSRLMCFGNLVNLSVLTYHTRIFMFKNSNLSAEDDKILRHQWFFKDSIKDKYRKFFDFKLPRTTKEEKRNIKTELEMAIEICESAVNFVDIRSNIFTLNEYSSLYLDDRFSRVYVTVNCCSRCLISYRVFPDWYYNCKIITWNILRSEYGFNLPVAKNFGLLKK